MPYTGKIFNPTWEATGELGQGIVGAFANAYKMRMEKERIMREQAQQAFLNAIMRAQEGRAERATTLSEQKFGQEQKEWGEGLGWRKEQFFEEPGQAMWGLLTPEQQAEAGYLKYIGGPKSAAEYRKGTGRITQPMLLDRYAKIVSRWEQATPGDRDWALAIREQIMKNPTLLANFLALSREGETALPRAVLESFMFPEKFEQIQTEKKVEPKPDRVDWIADRAREILDKANQPFNVALRGSEMTIEEARAQAEREYIELYGDLYEKVFGVPRESAQPSQVPQMELEGISNDALDQIIYDLSKQIGQ